MPMLKSHQRTRWQLFPVLAEAFLSDRSPLFSQLPNPEVALNRLFLFSEAKNIFLSVGGLGKRNIADRKNSVLFIYFERCDNF